MGDGSSIEWLQRPGTQAATWNMIRASREVHADDDKVGDDVRTITGWYCEHVHDGCTHCYAETQNLAGFRGGTRLPYKPGHRKDVEIFLDERTLLQPLKWKGARTIFPCSMTDLFGEWVADEWLDQIFTVMSRARQHTFIVLTKRIERAQAYFAARQTGDPFAAASDAIADLLGIDHQLLVPEPGDFPLPNVWLLCSCSRQEDFDRFVPILQATPAALRGVSAEPLLESITNPGIMFGTQTIRLPKHPTPPIVTLTPDTTMRDAIEALGGSISTNLPPIDWLIVGGESGHKARPCPVEAIEELIVFGRQVGIPVFTKQLGSRPTQRGRPLALAHRKGADTTEWPSDLRTRQWPHGIDR